MFRRTFLLATLVFFFTRNTLAEDLVPIKVLLIGNSYMFYPGSPVRPQLAADLNRLFRESKTYEGIKVDAFAKPGYNLKQHFEDPRLQEKLKAHYQTVVLQGQSLEAIEMTEPFVKGGISNDDFQKYARLIQDKFPRGTKIYLFAHWIRNSGEENRQANAPGLRFGPQHPKAGQRWDGDSDREYQNKINEGYKKVATKPDSKVLMIGDHWMKILNSPGTPFTTQDFYNSDGSHPTAIGTFFNACLLFKEITLESPFKYNIKTPGLNKAQVDYLKNYLKKI